MAERTIPRGLLWTLAVLLVFALLACVAVPWHNIRLERERAALDMARAQTAEALARWDFLQNGRTEAVCYRFALREGALTVAACTPEGEEAPPVYDEIIPASRRYIGKTLLVRIDRTGRVRSAGWQ